MTSVPPPPSQRASRRPWLAALGQWLAPGWGYFYLGRWGWAMIWGSLTLFGFSLLSLSRAWLDWLPVVACGVVFFGLHAMITWHVWKLAKTPERWGVLPSAWLGGLIWLGAMGGYLVLNSVLSVPPSRFRMANQSMTPTILPGERFWVNSGPLWVPRIQQNAKEAGIQRGDLVLVASRHANPSFLIRRVLGVPGDTLEIREGLLFLNGQPLESPRLPSSWREALPETSLYRHHAPLALVEGQVYLMPDHLESALGSCCNGPWPLALIQGRVRSIYYSPQWSRIGQDLTLPQAP